MDWGRFDEAAWWWQYGLDGFGGALVGGAVTGFALAATIRHERRMAELSAARDAALKVQSLSWRVGKAVQNGPDDVKEWSPVVSDLHDSVLLFQTLTLRRWPLAYEDVTDELRRLSRLLQQHPRYPHTDELLSAAAAVGGSASSWAIDPKQYRQSFMRRLLPRRGRQS